MPRRVALFHVTVFFYILRQPDPDQRFGSDTTFGVSVESEEIMLNDVTLWSGEPVYATMNPQAHTHLPAIREALQNENYALADSLNRKLQGKFSESYAPLGALYLHFQHDQAPQTYYRELNIADAVSTVKYESDGTSRPMDTMEAYFLSKEDRLKNQEQIGDVIYYKCVRCSNDAKEIMRRGHPVRYAAISYR